MGAMGVRGGPQNPRRRCAPATTRGDDPSESHATGTHRGRWPAASTSLTSSSAPANTRPRSAHLPAGWACRPHGSLPPSSPREGADREAGATGDRTSRRDRIAWPIGPGGLQWSMIQPPQLATVTTAAHPYRSHRGRPDRTTTAVARASPASPSRSAVIDPTNEHRPATAAP